MAIDAAKLIIPLKVKISRWDIMRLRLALLLTRSEINVKVKVGQIYEV